MVYQSQSNATMAWKKQTALGSQASGASGNVFRLAGGSGGRLTKAATESAEVRRDGQETRGRHGIQKTAGQWSGQVSLGSHENIVEAILRDTWETADLVITQATAGLTSITTTAGPPSTIVATAGSWLTAGLKVGDVVRLTLFNTTANNNRNLRITALSATVMTVAESLTTDAAADTTFTVTRPKKLIQNGAVNGNTLVKRYYTIDEYDADIDLSEVLTDFVFSTTRFSMAPNGIIMGDITGIGTGQWAGLTTGTSPLLTSPVEGTTSVMAVVDATLRVSPAATLSTLTTADQVALTSFDCTIDCQATAPDVFGSGAIKYAPDVFSGQLSVTANMGMLRPDIGIVTDFGAETVYSLWVLAVPLMSEPKDFFSIFIPNITFGGVDKSALARAGGPRTQTISIPNALTGKDLSGGAGTAFDATTIKFQSSAGALILTQ